MGDTPAVELTADSVADYLRERDVLPPDVEADVAALGGGISNDVWRVGWDGGCIVVKQALPFLRVEEEWAYTVERSSVEHRCLSAINRLLGPGAAPAVAFADDDAHAFGMECAPAGGVQWKELLLAGQVDPADGARAGELLGRIHAASAADPAVAAEFDDATTMLEGRVEPYHRFAAARHPDLAPLIEAEVGRMLATRRALVLGDYAPKNLIRYPDRMLVLDVEVAHWGDPSFDVAFCLNHLLLKALHLPAHGAALCATARAFLDAYETAAPALVDEQAAVAELGVLMVARVDGKSPAEYLDDRSRNTARAMGRSLLLDPPATTAAAVARVEALA